MATSLTANETLLSTTLPSLLSAILLGLVEGVTEFLPISSTGHLLIAEHWLGARSDLFNIVIQAGAILAVTLIYRDRLWELMVRSHEPENRRYAAQLLTAFVITAVLGAVAVELGLKLPDTVQPVAWAMVIGGLVMVVAEWAAARMPERREISWSVVVAVGVAQRVAAIFPGTSRSAAAIFAAMLAGTSNRSAATEFAFLVGIPTMYAAGAYALLKELRHGTGAEHWDQLAVAFLVSTVAAFVAVKWLLGYVRTHRFTGFAVYRIVLGVALLLLA
jgi:undecaprenyl-diphosphatase